MNRLLIVDPAENTRVPFLRGILTRSLQDSGLSFDDSYKLASVVRDELAEQGEITRDELRDRVVKLLQPYGAAIVQRYREPTPTTPTILVHHSAGDTVPYSRGYNRLSLEACGFATEDAIAISTALHEDLARSQTARIEASAIRKLTYEHVSKALGEEAGRNYLIWQEFRMSGRPLLILMGGTPGVGKSTVTTQAANLLEIVRIQSTDMLREVMRMMMPERLLPVLHTSSFKAWERLPGLDRARVDPGTLLEDGYLHQAELLSVACEAVVQRALTERVSLFLEGVHVHPKLREHIPEDSDTIVVPLVLAVLKRRDLKARIRGRSKYAVNRRAQRYLNHFDSIWRLQSFLLSEADRYGVPIVTNEDKEKTLRDVLLTVQDALAREFTGDPARVLT